MKQEVLIGQTDYTVLVLIRDTTGAPQTGLDEGDIDIAFARVETDNDVTTTDVTPAALTALTDAHTDWGFEEVSATDHPGLYRLDLADAVFASGAWSAVVSITGTGLDPCQIEFVLVAFNPRDGVRLGLTALPNAAADGAGGLPISDAGGLDLDAQIGTKINSILDDTDLIDDGTSGLAKIATDVAAVLVDTAEIGAAGAGLTEAGGTGDHLTALGTAAELAKVPKSDGTASWNATALGAIQGEAEDALEAMHLDHLLAADYDPQAKPGVAGALLNEMVESDDASPGRARFTAGALEEAPTGGSAPTVEEIADEVQTRTIAAVTTVGSVSGNVAGSIGSLAAQAKADVNAEADAAIETYHLDHLLAAEYDPQSKPGAAGALLNEIVESDDASPARARFTAGALEEAPTGGSAPTADEIADEVETRTIAAVTTVGSVTGAVGSVTGNVGGNVAGSVGSLATQAKADVNAEVDQALADYDGPTKAELDAAQASIESDIADVQSTANTIEGQTDDIGTAGAGLTALGDTRLANLDATVSSRATQAQVASEVSDALTVDVVADSVPADGSRPTIAQAAYLLVQFMNERSVSGTTMTVKKPDGSTTLFTLTLNDATSPTSVTRTG